MPKATQLVINLKSKPGALARVASILGGAGVNIKAFHAPEVADQGLGKLRVLVADLAGARTALAEAKVTFQEESALVLSLDNQPGALSDVSDILKASGVNIICGYCTPSREGKRAVVVLTVSDTEKALEALRGRSLDEF